MRLVKSFAALTGAAVIAVSSMAISSADVEAATPIFEQQDYTVLTNVLGAVESGGQIYGNRDYGEYAAAYTNSKIEYTCTLGWAQFYGNEAQTLIQRIYNADPNTFRSIDSKKLIQNKLSVNWVNSRWNPSAEERKVLIRLITTEVGKAQQDAYFKELMVPFVRECASKYTNDIRATIMYCEIRHLGGDKAVNRIFGRLGNDYSVDNILTSLKKDQSDRSNNNQVGDTPFWSRHQKCAQWVKQYARSGGSSSAAQTNLPKNAANGTSYVYRLYNKNTGEHFYTVNPVETNHLEAVGWKYEGIGWTAPSSSTKPVYRVYNPNAGEHHYTINSAEKSMLVRAGWKDEGIAFYSDTSERCPIYREYNPNKQAFNHNYTPKVGEHNYLVSIGWKNEGIAWYAVS